MENDGHFPDLDSSAHTFKNLIKSNTSYTCNLLHINYIPVENVQKENRIFIETLPRKAKLHVLEIPINSI